MLLLYTYQHHQPARGSSSRRSVAWNTPYRSLYFKLRIFWKSWSRQDTSSQLSTISLSVSSLYFFGESGGMGAGRGRRSMCSETRCQECFVGECSVLMRNFLVLPSWGQKVFLRVMFRGTWSNLMDSFGQASPFLLQLCTDGLRTVSTFLIEFLIERYYETFSWQSLVRSLARCPLSLKRKNLFFLEQQRVRTCSLMLVWDGGCGGSGGCVGFELRERFLRRVGGWKSEPVCFNTMLGSRLRLCIINISLLAVIQIPQNLRLLIPYYLPVKLPLGFETESKVIIKLQWGF